MNDLVEQLTQRLVPGGALAFTFIDPHFQSWPDTYEGSNGYSMRLKGLEAGVNDMAWDRAIVMHGASYVSEEAVKVLGRLGRSWGCPAVRPEISQKIIDTIRGGSAVFAYYPEKDWLSSSPFLHGSN